MEARQIWIVPAKTNFHYFIIQHVLPASIIRKANFLCCGKRLRWSFLALCKLITVHMLKAASVLVNLVDYCSTLFLVVIKVEDDTDISGELCTDLAQLCVLQNQIWWLSSPGPGPAKPLMDL